MHIKLKRVKRRIERYYVELTKSRFKTIFKAKTTEKKDKKVNVQVRASEHSKGMIPR